jgi:hypothetical protein
MAAISHSEAPLAGQTESWFSALRASLFVIRVPIAMAVLTGVVLTVPEQVQEVYRVLAQERTSEINFQYHWIIAVFSLIALSIVFLQLARGLTYDYHTFYGAPHPVAHLVLTWGPRLIAASPLIAAAVGLWLCVTKALAGTDPLLTDFLRGTNKLRQDFYLGMVLCLVLAAIVFIGAALYERKVDVSAAEADDDSARRIARYSNWVLFPLIAAGSTALLAWDNIQMPQLFGVVAVFCLWMVIVALLVAVLGRFSLFAVPVLALLVLFVLGIEYFRLADNHAIRNRASMRERVAVEDAFKRWIGSRKDFPAYQATQKPYPVYIIASEGGGLYAAYVTAQFLARMQDLCPSFAQHVFAISSVSGGSLGAAVFAGQISGDPKFEQPAPCKRGAAPPGDLERQARAILSGDFLAPVVWGGLFPDFLQRFIPYPFPELDRARTLELAFEKAWRYSGHSVNPMTESFFGLCSANMRKCIEGATPTLALNVTNVETGLQMVLSPLDLRTVGANNGANVSPSRKIYDFFEFVDPFDLQLSTAVGLSARFPYISPPGWYAWDDEGTSSSTGKTAAAKSNRKRFTFVDGAYVDNSGVSTALNIAQHLDGLTPRPNVEFRIIMISALWAPLDRLWIDPPRDEARGELSPPLDAANSARQGRGFKTQFDAALESKPGLSISEIGFYYGYLELPLGWQLSEMSRSYVRLFRGEPERCPLDNEDNYKKYISRSVASHDQAAVAYIKRADCVVARIRSELNPAEPPLKLPPINTAN